MTNTTHKQALANEALASEALAKVLDTVVTRFQPTKQCTEYEQPQGKMTGFWHNA